MELRQLSYFRAVAETGSFVRASEVLNIAQPALSHQIGKLEAEVGLKLFVRHPRGVWLTEAGQLFVPHAEQILRSVQDAHRALEDLSSEQPRGTVTIAMPTMIALLLAQPILEGIRAELPEVSVQIVEALSGEIRQWYASDRFDLTVLYEHLAAPPDGAVPLCREDLYFLRRSSPNSHFAETVRFADLADRPLHHTSRIHACRSLLDETAERTGVLLRIAAEINSIQLLQELVICEDAVSVFPCIAPPAGVGIAYQRIVDPGLYLQSFIAPPRTRPVTRAGRALMRLMPRLARRVADKTRIPVSRKAEAA